MIRNISQSENQTIENDWKTRGKKWKKFMGGSYNMGKCGSWFIDEYRV